MRVIPILTAILVMAGLFMIIFERDRLLDFARGGPVIAADEPPEAPGSDAVTLPDQAEQAGASGPVSVIALKSRAREIDGAVLLRGRTEASRQVVMKAETSGRIISEPLRKGHQVAMGELLCRLDPGTSEARLTEAQARLDEARARQPETAARVAEAEARVAEAEINLNAAEKLHAEGFASETRVISAKAALQSARAGLVAASSGAASSVALIQAAAAGVAAANREVSRLEITAPFAGFLETDTAELGTLLQPGANCATIVQLNPIKLVGFVPEINVHKINPGVMAGGRLATGRELAGRVTFLSRVADPLTRTFRVEIEVANPDQVISDGLSVEILIAAEGRRAHLLPQSSLALDDAGVLGVRIVGAGNITRFVPIELIRDTVEGIWVAGLDDEVSVIIVGQEYVSEGVALDVTLQEPDA